MSRPSLQVFDQVAIRNRARRRYAIVATFVVLLAGLFAVALIQAQLVANQHRLDRLRSEIAESEVEQTRLERLVEEASAPSAIIDQAMSMGMVRATNPVYLAPSESAVTVPVPISLGSTEPKVSDNTITATADSDLISAGVEAALDAVASSSVSLAPNVANESKTPVEAATSETPVESGVASLAGATASSEGLGDGSDPTATKQSSVAEVIVESALPAIDSSNDAIVQERSSPGPVWAGAVAVSGSNG